VNRASSPQFGRSVSMTEVGALAALVFVFAPRVSVLEAGDRPPEQVPSFVSWTHQTITEASSGSAFRGMLLARRCEHCHGAEGFSATASTPNLAGLDKLALWKEMEDFRSGKRSSAIMEPIATSLTSRDVSDLAAYFAMLPIFSDPQDNRVFPQSPSDPRQASTASRLTTFGDGERGIPPCQACHGPVAYRIGAPALMAQNADYILSQLDAFARGLRSNDIDMPMRTIAGLLSEDERHDLAAYYGSGLGVNPPGLTEPKSKP
jgi:cytochrome c553